MSGDGLPERLTGAEVSADFFRTLGIVPALGRTFTDEDERPAGEHVVVLSHDLWQRRYGGQEAVLGRRLFLDGLPHTVVGVMPPGCAFPARTELWLPLPLGPAELQDFEDTSLTLVGRLRPGLTRKDVEGELAALVERLRPQYPEYRKAWHLTAVPLRESIVGWLRPILSMLVAGVGMVLLIACANVANILLGLAVTRRREIAVRVALGAGPGRIARQVLTECMLVAIVGGGAGLLLACWGR